MLPPGASGKHAHAWWCALCRLRATFGLVDDVTSLSRKSETTDGRGHPLLIYHLLKKKLCLKVFADATFVASLKYRRKIGSSAPLA